MSHTSYRQKTVKVEVPCNNLGFWQMDRLTTKLQAMVSGGVMSYKILDM